MAYENMTYEYILQRMKDRIEVDYPNIDIREGSIIFNALAPAALELAIMYTEIDNVLNESFIDTASREYIMLGCTQMGIDTTQFEASAGVHKGEFNIGVPIGSRWNCDLYNYVVTEFIETIDGYRYFRMECETLGTEPNLESGDLTPLSESPTGLTHAKLVECLIEGENEASDEKVKEYYFEHINKNATDGNVKQYEKWCDEYDGIGNYKIFPLWNGTGTVKVSILSSSNQVASDQLINDFQNYLDPNTTGMGDGIAPIGAFVTVTTATEIPINITANVVLANGYDSTVPIDDALELYFNQMAYDKYTISYMSVGATILDVEGVETITNLRINGGTSDITLNEEEIPVLGTTDWTVG